MILGHSDCGAIKAYLNGFEDESFNISSTDQGSAGRYYYGRSGVDLARERLLANNGEPVTFKISNQTGETITQVYAAKVTPLVAVKTKRWEAGASGLWASISRMPVVRVWSWLAAVALPMRRRKFT